jgi:hypothetical protein
MKNQLKRYYFHGDRKEGTENLYYCASCDFFEPREHFYNSASEFCLGSSEYDRYYERTKKTFNKAYKKYGYYRPRNPPSIL